jgi:hypothetical protein
MESEVSKIRASINDSYNIKIDKISKYTLLKGPFCGTTIVYTGC